VKSLDFDKISFGFGDKSFHFDNKSGGVLQLPHTAIFLGLIYLKKSVEYLVSEVSEYTPPP